jgi:hypothetical protein
MTMTTTKRATKTEAAKMEQPGRSGRRGSVRRSPAARSAREAARRSDRELALLKELQRDHDWMFGDLPKVQDRESMMMRKVSVRGRDSFELVVARKAIVVVPSTSVLARAMNSGTPRSRSVDQGRGRRGSIGGKVER